MISSDRATGTAIKHNMIIIITCNRFMSALMLLGLNLRFLPGRFGNNVKNEAPIVFKDYF